MNKLLTLIASMLIAVPCAQAAETTEKLVVGAGCFWCLEAVYERVPGVIDVVSGYAGGTTENPTYKQVTKGNTGHAEVIEITYDPTKTNIQELLTYFWKSHDPTDPRGVAPDFGPNYRSIILYRDDEQKRQIDASKAAAAKNYDKAIATEISALTKFWRAEEEHQNYVKENPNNPYVQRVSIPRVKETGLKP